MLAWSRVNLHWSNLISAPLIFPFIGGMVRLDQNRASSVSGLQPDQMVASKPSFRSARISGALDRMLTLVMSAEPGLEAAG